MRLTTKDPFVVLPNLFASYFALIVAKGSVDNNGPGIGAGPFMLAGQERGRYIDLVAFDRFYIPGLPKLKSIRMIAYADENTRVAALRSGDVDLIEYVPWSEMTSIKYDPALRLQTTQGPFMHMYFNAKSGPFSDARVRRAAALAVRRDEIVSAAFFGRGVPLEGLPIERSSPFYNEKVAHGWAYDPVQAKALLAAAGAGGGFDCKLLATSTYGMIKSTAEVLQSHLAEIGIRAELVLPGLGHTHHPRQSRPIRHRRQRHNQREQRSRRHEQLSRHRSAGQLHPRLWALAAAGGRAVGRGAAQLRSGPTQGHL